MSLSRTAESGIANQVRAMVRQVGKNARDGRHSGEDLHAVREAETIMRQGRKIADLRGELEREIAETVRLGTALEAQKAETARLVEALATSERLLGIAERAIANKPPKKPRAPYGSKVKALLELPADQPIWNPAWG